MVIGLRTVAFAMAAVELVTKPAESPMLAALSMITVAFASSFNWLKSVVANLLILTPIFATPPMMNEPGPRFVWVNTGNIVAV